MEGILATVIATVNDIQASAKGGNIAIRSITGCLRYLGNGHASVGWWYYITHVSATSHSRARDFGGFTAGHRRADGGSPSHQSTAS